MKAIFEDRTKQYTVQIGDIFPIDKMENIKNDQKLEFNNILLYTNDKNETTFGAPYLDGATVKATVVNDIIKDKKILVFKYKKRKNYKRLRGHRQQYTMIKIDEIKA